MSDQFITFRSSAGWKQMLVPAAHLREWSAESAYRELRAAMRDGFCAGRLRALAEERRDSIGDDDAVARYLAGEVASGRLVILTLPDNSMRGMRPVVYGPPAPTDWSEVPLLSSLSERESTDEFGWVSIELVDARGVPFADVEVTLVHADGRRDRVQLDVDGRHQARRVLLPGPTRVLLPPRLELPPASRNAAPPLGFSRLPGDLAVAVVPVGPLVLSPLDRHYRIVVDASPWRAKFVMDDGAPLSRLDIVVMPTGKGELAAATDAVGEVSLAELAASDAVAVSISRPPASRVPYCRGVTDGFVASPYACDFPFGNPARAELPVGGLEVVVRRPVVLRVDAHSVGFARESSILAPLDATRSHLVALAAAVSSLARNRTQRLLAVGHASADGDPDANAALGRQRARCIQLLLNGDRDGWVELATDHGTPADIQRLLTYLARSHAWPCDPGRTDGVMDDDVATAVARFQQQYSDIYDAEIDTDGVVGTQTLGALFDTQSYELHEHIAALGGSTDSLVWYDDDGIDSAGADVLSHPAIEESSSPDGQRRVDLLLAPADLGWARGDGVALLYRVARFQTIPLPAVAAGRRDLVVRVVDHYGRPVANEPYVVTTDVERREGTTDDAGILVERGLAGELSRLECGGAARVPADRGYEDQCLPRVVRTAATDLPDDDEDDAEDEDEDHDDAREAADPSLEELLEFDDEGAWSSLIEADDDDDDRDAHGEE
jgi:hypothetical protein